MNKKEHAWFVSYAPKGAPEIGGVALVEHAGHGGTESAPIIKACFEEYLRKKKGLPKEELAQDTKPNKATNNPAARAETPVKPTTKPPVNKPEKPVVKPVALVEPLNNRSIAKPANLGGQN
ncbi:MAG: hypothetical protein IPK14_12350 [Blastocatellia bacterium]|nr:hypothetical protein [Blastocatellia bacterium]